MEKVALQANFHFSEMPQQAVDVDIFDGDISSSRRAFKDLKVNVGGSLALLWSGEAAIPLEWVSQKSWNYL